MIDLTTIGTAHKGEQVASKGTAPAKPVEASAQKAEISPVKVHSVVVFERKGEAANDAIAQALKSAGFSIDKAVKNEDHTISYLQSEEIPTDAKAIRLSDQVLVVVDKGFVPCADLSESDFASSVNASGFYQGVDSALDVLFGKICSILQDADDPKGASTDIGNLVDGFKDYVGGLVKGLPTEAFKADLATRALIAEKKDQAEKDAKDAQKLADKKQKDADKAKDDAKDEKDAAQAAIDCKADVDLLNVKEKTPTGFTGNPDDWSTFEDGESNTPQWDKDSTNSRAAQNPVTAKVVENTSKADKGVLDIEALEKAAQKVPEGFTQSPDDWAAMSLGDKLDWIKDSTNKANSSGAQDTAKADSTVIDAFGSKLDSILGAFETLKVTVADIAKKQEEVNQRVDTAVKKSEDVDRKVSGIVLAPPTIADTPARGASIAQKADSDPRTGCFDTAFIRRQHRR